MNNQIYKTSDDDSAEAARVAAASSSVQESPVSNDDVSISADDDFEEFAPAGEEA